MFAQLDNRVVLGGSFRYIIVKELDGRALYLLEGSGGDFEDFDDDYVCGYPQTFRFLDEAEDEAEGHEGSQVVIWENPEYAPRPNEFFDECPTDKGRIKGWFYIVVQGEQEADASFLLARTAGVEPRDWPFQPFKSFYAKGYPVTFAKFKEAKQVADVIGEARVVLWKHPESND